MSRQVYLDAPNLGKREKKYLAQAIDAGYVSTIGPLVNEFEDIFARYLGVARGVSTQSGTAALHMALYELGIGKGDEVIVPALTFVATVSPVMQVGARPVFVDIDPVTWNIDTEQIERSITGKTKAILPVHLYGNPCNMDTIQAIARKHALAVIEDATESLGAMYRRKLTGTFGKFGCFSFNGNKTITTGGGGMVAGNDRKKMAHIKFLVNQARDESKGYYHPEVGFNYRMTNIEAALGLAQWERLREFLKRKEDFHEVYREELEATGFVRFQKEYPGASSSWWLTCVTFEEGIAIDKMQNALKEKGIQTRRVFMPVPEFPPYKKFIRSSYRNAHAVYRHGLCLPSSTLNTLNDIKYTCRAIKGICAAQR